MYGLFIFFQASVIKDSQVAIHEALSNAHQLLLRENALQSNGNLTRLDINEQKGREGR